MCVALVVVVFVLRLFFWIVDFHCFVGSFSLLCNIGDLVSTYKIVRRFASIAFVKVCEMFTVIFCVPLVLVMVVIVTLSRCHISFNCCCSSSCSCCCCCGRDFVKSTD